jgi:hypothetical protein
MDPGGEKKEAKEEPALVTMARFSGHGLTLAMSTAAFLFLGKWADSKLGTAPWLTLLGAMVGAAGGFYHMLQHLVFLPQEEERKKRAGSDGVGTREKDAPK